MEKEIGKVHRLALPLIVKRTGTAILVSDGLFGHEFEFKDFGQIRVLGIDKDGFVTFEISSPTQQTLLESSRHEKLGDLGSFTLLGSSTSKTSGSGVSRGTYEYFKRSTDEFFYAVHKMGGKEDKKIYLGSLQDPLSHLRQIAKACQRFDESIWFGRSQLAQPLQPSLKHGQKLKSALDILVLEGYLERTESHKKGKMHEEYRITSKLRGLK
jgi:hypothetical protein